MSTLSQFIGGGPTTSIVNFHSSGGTSTAAVGAAATSGGREELSGELTANTLKTLLTVTGAGRASMLSAYAKDTTSRTVRLVVEVDGVAVFDATSEAVTASGAGIFAAGSWTATNVFTPNDPIVFTASLVVKVATSVASETDKVAIAYILNKR